MNHRIETMDSFRIVGLKTTTTNENMQGMKDAPAFWAEVIGAQKQMALMPLMNAAPMGLIGACVYNVDKGDARVFDYYIAVSSTSPAPEGMSEYTVPAATWAVFPCKMNEIGRVQEEIITKWMPTSGYRALNQGYESGEMTGKAPDLEVYGQGDDVEIWVSVKKN